MQNGIEERPNIFPWPPVLLVGALADGFLINWLWPLSPPEGVARIVLAVIGACLVCTTVALDVTAMLALRRARTTIMPHKGSDALVTDGPFTKIRNPIYLGNVFLVAGLGLLIGNVWLVAMAPILGIAIDKLAIEREEAHLKARFGKAYEDYMARTKRWI